MRWMAQAWGRAELRACGSASAGAGFRAAPRQGLPAGRLLLLGR